MKNLLVIPLLLSCFLIKAQQNFEPAGEFKLPKADAFTVDQFRNLYIIYNGELTKLDPQARELYAYSNPMFGDIYSIDVLNPLSPYVFHKNTNRLVVLDNRLNESSELNFTDHGFMDVQFISFSDEDNVWFYDQVTDKLYRFNIRQKRQTRQSLNITQILGRENQPENMVSTVNNVYLNIPGEGIYIFEATGAFSGVLALKSVQNFDVYQDKLLAITEEGVVFYNLKTGRTVPVLFSESDWKDVKFSNQRLYLFDGSLLKSYHYRPSSSNE